MAQRDTLPSITVSFPCASCGLVLWFESPWDLLHLIDLECAKCSALYLIQITQPLKRKYADADPSTLFPG